MFVTKSSRGGLEVECWLPIQCEVRCLCLGGSNPASGMYKVTLSENMMCMLCMCVMQLWFIHSFREIEERLYEHYLQTNKKTTHLHCLWNMMKGLKWKGKQVVDDISKFWWKLLLLESLINFQKATPKSTPC